ncbi:hypothetical protein [Enterococcus termitis]|uniref:Uncharacterized protein n=1 Tax=Enterococcus termitis TaxID=332950 RepID=A0A1E5GIG5_9ENTE|nr:hypothetical protein [Enterococcus termitis]OEG12479.1 hypothetical protein BCR25_08050 [Enterococcus termitis]OJG96693.1 hypothetical protein RV18_GL001979 [Enterococcus termitis]
MKAYEIKKLIKFYSASATLGEIFEDFGRPYECPQCEGTGFYQKKVVVPYPRGLPDSGWVPDSIEYKRSQCELCDGHGYSDKEYKPKMVQDGWQEN